ncbi:MAG: monomeric sarcosine oxidase, partial [Proteobacteria bacterium SW_6_67_9]
VETDHGAIATDYVVVGVGPWVKQVWEMLDLPARIDVTDRQGQTHSDVRMWHYQSLQEGTLGVDPGLQRTNAGRMPPVIHVDSDRPLYSDVDGRLITDRMWGIYYKPDFHFGGIQGGAAPVAVERDPDEVAVDPYGPESPDFVVGTAFAPMWVSALAFCQRRFSGTLPYYKDEPSGGLGCFTPDNFPVFDVFHQNCYFIADSNHGYKMIGIGDLVSQELLGEPSALLAPFRFERYRTGELHPTSNSPFPWS